MDPSKPNERLRSRPEAEGVQTHVRQSVLYSDRHRRSRRRRPALHVEHPGEAGSSQLDMEVTDFEALSVSDSYAASPSLTEEHPSEVGSSELGKTVTDLPTLEALSLSDPQLLTPETAEESDDDDAPPEPTGFGFETLGPQTLHYSVRPPRPKWLRGVRGQAMFEEPARDASSVDLDSTVIVPSRPEARSVSDSSFASQSTEEKPRKDPDADTEEELRLLREYFDANPSTSWKHSLEQMKAAEHAALTALAAKWGREPPPPRKHSPVNQEAQSLQAQQKASAAAADPQPRKQPSTASRKPRCEASTEEIIRNAEQWMRDEVMLVFEKYAKRRADLMVLDCRFDELRHQCFSVENYNKVFHHYNFTVRMKKPNSADWIVALYFAEVKQIFGRKSYFCCRLEPNENGHCYACKNQGVEDLQHPATGGFDAGSPDLGFSLWYTNE